MQPAEQPVIIWMPFNFTELLRSSASVTLENREEDKEEEEETLQATGAESLNSA